MLVHPHEALPGDPAVLNFFLEMRYVHFLDGRPFYKPQMLWALMLAG
jgi:hypothetical protein